MSKIYPISNDLKKVSKNCPVCGSFMSDEGVSRDFFAPYSAYITKQNTNQTTCLHLLNCHNCNYHEQVSYSPVKL
ncbi:hypothetical protein LJC10_00890 [Selenomonadales bacterium OttesenSCG-928-I06]|nr:hypothetical protein [Selenomonadales bacterium OttesenSCG-928-I06]